MWSVTIIFIIFQFDRQFNVLIIYLLISSRLWLILWKCVWATRHNRLLIKETHFSWRSLFCKEVGFGYYVLSTYYEWKGVKRWVQIASRSSWNWYSYHPKVNANNEQNIVFCLTVSISLWSMVYVLLVGWESFYLFSLLGTDSKPLWVNFFRALAITKREKR